MGTLEGFCKARRRGGAPLNWRPSAHAVAGNAAPLNWGRSADAVAGNDGMLPLVLDYLPHIPVSQQPMELVEREGLGHPDSICDAIMEAISVALCQTYLNATGQVLHHNIDKSVLVAGQTTPALGGGTVQAPMRLIVGDRATVEWQGQRFPVGAIAEATRAAVAARASALVDPDRHVVVQHALQPGSPSSWTCSHVRRSPTIRPPPWAMRPSPRPSAVCCPPSTISTPRPSKRNSLRPARMSRLWAAGRAGT